MVEVYISHFDEPGLVNVDLPIVCQPGTLQSISQQIEARYPGFLPVILDEQQRKLRSSVLIFKNVEINGDGRWLEGPHTTSINNLNAAIDDFENLLIAIFDPVRVMSLLTARLSQADEILHHAGGNSEYRAFISTPTDELNGQSLWIAGEPEALYPFSNGRPINELIATGRISPTDSQLIPVRLRDAIARLWELDNNFSLRLFQEEALTHILRELHQPSAIQKQPLLLSIPTGGGKTEAFLIPLIAHLYDQKLAAQTANRIRSLIIYPTRALANDQARRITEILYTLNEKSMNAHKVTVGVLTGDTPSSDYNLVTEKSLLQVCPACSAVLADFRSRPLTEDKKLSYVRCSCGAEIDFFRLTRADILNAPPDILITSPDMINRTLQSPRYHRQLFTEAIETVVFDEVHMYDGIFGCNVAHLLRRFEAACGHKPLYVGVSATIRNAKTLASLIFDAALDDVLYLRPAAPEEAVSKEKRPYLNYNAPPVRLRHHYAVAPARIKPGKFQKTITATLNIADALGHLIRDPHFRKTLIFGNFRQDTDDVVRFLRDQEARYYRPYQESILPKLLSATAQVLPDLSKAEVDISRAIDRWYRHWRAIGSLYEPELEIGWHRGGLEKQQRIKAVNRFAATRRLTASSEAGGDEWPIDMMVATRTLELGIDIGDVTTVINTSAPFTVNEYTQRVGRGGRRRDSLALTVVNPTSPVDFYYLRHFDRFAHPTAADYEDAPIIISNQEVLLSHLYARLLDWLARYLNSDKEELQATDLKTARILKGKDYISFEKEHEAFANAIFDELLPPPVITQLQTWIQREADAIPGVQPTQINEANLRAMWQAKMRRLHERTCGRKADIAEIDYISGMGAKDRDLVPDMRSSGPQTGLYLVREGNDDELRDTIGRSQAISSRPIGGFVAQGSVTYRVENIKERDTDAERHLKEIFGRHPRGAHAIAYFHRMFGDEDQESIFPDNPMDVLINLDLQTPKDLTIKYHPYRFYCAQCGATYSDKRAGDERCICGAELRQLTEVYMCGGCGDIFLPPVPKVCINPECVAQAKHRRDGTPFMEVIQKIDKYDRHNDYFRFTALPRLKWRCRNCGTEINYHAYYELPASVTAKLNSAPSGQTTPASVAKNFLFQPESYWGKDYDTKGWHRARFSCRKCKDANQYRKIHVANIPNHRSVIHEYLIQDDSFAPPLSHDLGIWSFHRIKVISLAREMYRRFFSYPEQEMHVYPGSIFSENSRYLANIYETHSVWLQLSPAIEAFIDSSPLVADYLRGDADVCHNLSPTLEDNETDQDVEAGEMTSPLAALNAWEQGRKPDPRRMWCDVVRGEVPNKRCEDNACEHCRIHAFDRKRFVRYLILHTIKHALILALPRFTGADKNQLRGYIYPNDSRDYDLALVDRIVGGSGCLYLLRTNWDAIWQMTGELLDAARFEQGQLLLPYTCSRYNRDLCAPLAFAFYEFLQSGSA